MTRSEASSLFVWGNIIVGLVIWANVSLGAAVLYAGVAMIVAASISYFRKP